MKNVIRCEHRTLPDGTQQPGCGAAIVMVLVIPTNLSRNEPRKKIPINATYDPSVGIPPSHAVEIDWTRCRPLKPGESIDSHEHPALTHFATCPHRRQHP